MQQFWRDMGGIDNATPGGAYNGQSAGYYSAGNLFARTKVKNTNLGSLQLPSYRAGCGGIDMFAGSFSFINSDQLISVMNAIGANATSFAFKLALDTLSPQIGQQIAELQKTIQDINSFQINSCEQAAALVGGAWPASDEASKSVCASIGNHRGIFSDYAAAKHNCATGGRRASTLASDGDEYKNVKTENTNIAWKAIKDSNLFGSGGSFDTEMAELFMTLSGTVIMKAGANDDDPAQFQYIDSKVATGEVIGALLDGGSISVIHCDEEDKCLNPTVDGATHTLSADNAFQARVQKMLEDISTRIMAESGGSSSPLTAQELGFLNMTSIPIYKVLNVYSAYSGASSYFELNTYGEIIASDILFEYLRKVMKDIETATSRLNVGDSKDLAEFKTGLESAKKDLAARETKTSKKLDTLLSLVQRTTFIENLLASKLSSSASDSLKWSNSFK